MAAKENLGQMRISLTLGRDPHMRDPSYDLYTLSRGPPFETLNPKPEGLSIRTFSDFLTSNPQALEFIPRSEPQNVRSQANSRMLHAGGFRD